MTSQAVAASGPATGSALLEPAAIEANRAGRLTDDQRRGFGALDRAWRKNWLGLAGVFTILGLLLFTATGPNPEAWLRPIAGAAFLALAAFSVIRSLPANDPLAHDLAAGRVDAVEGPMGKRKDFIPGSKGGTDVYYLDVADSHFEIHSHTYEVLPDAGIVRAYYLPRSRKVVNVERLADAPIPAGALDNPVQATTTLLHEAAHGHGAERLQAMAEMSALGDAVLSQFKVGPPPAPDQRDQRPLAQAIVGTWAAGPFRVTFEPDGTVHALLGGREQRGHWSVDGSGRLHADALGHRDGAGDAWVAGDALTISADGQGITLHRVTGA